MISPHDLLPDVSEYIKKRTPCSVITLYELTKAAAEYLEIFRSNVDTFSKQRETLNTLKEKTLK